jgi:uncharacterized integral membrane protein
VLADPPPAGRHETGIDTVQGTHPPERDRVRRSHAGLLGFVAGAVVAIAVALLIVQNTHDTEIEWLFVSGDAATWLVLLITFLAGALAAMLLQIGARYSARRRR